MKTLYFQGKPVEWDGPLSTFLADVEPWGKLISLDTETSGLYVDGDWQDGPPARVSAVPMAWERLVSDTCGACYGDMVGVHVGGEHHPRCEGDAHVQYLEIQTLAIPFDQGWVGGKPGRWSDELDTYEELRHTEECHREWFDGVCICAPWNFGFDDWEALATWLQDKRIVMHNAKFDLHTMNAGLRGGERVASNYALGVDLSNQVEWDTMLAQQLLDPLERPGLDSSCQRLFGEGKDDTALNAAMKRNGVGLTKRYDLVSWGDMGSYAAQDAKLTLMLFKHQMERFERNHASHVEWELLTGNLGEFRAGEIPFMKLLFKMECRRFGFDVEGMREAAIQMQQHVDKLKAELPWVKRGDEPNVNGAKRWFFDTLAILPIKTTPKGAPSLDAEVAQRLADDRVEGAKEWVEIAKAESALSKWYRAWPYKAHKEADGSYRLMTNFRQGKVESDRKGMNSGGAVSGRLSAERIQAQGVPHDTKLPSYVKTPKQLLKARKGYQLWELDISNAEVRVAAWLMQSVKLAEACASGNVHSANCRMMFGAMLAETHPNRPDADLETHPEWGDYRKVAKTTVLGQFFGAGVRRLKAQVEMATKKPYSERKIREFMEMTNRVTPELQRVSRKMSRMADKSQGGIGWVKLVNGRKRWFGWGERTHKAFNSCTQGGVAEVMKCYMLMVEKSYPGCLVNQVHDSVWVEVSDSEVELGIIDGMKSMGERMFTKAFSTDFLPIEFELDAKRLDAH